MIKILNKILSLKTLRNGISGAPKISGFSSVSRRKFT